MIRARGQECCVWVNHGSRRPHLAFELDEHADVLVVREHLDQLATENSREIPIRLKGVF